GGSVGIAAGRGGHGGRKSAVAWHRPRRREGSHQRLPRSQPVRVALRRLDRITTADIREGRPLPTTAGAGEESQLPPTREGAATGVRLAAQELQKGVRVTTGEPVRLGHRSIPKR